MRGRHQQTENKVDESTQTRRGETPKTKQNVHIVKEQLSGSLQLAHSSRKHDVCTAGQDAELERKQDNYQRTFDIQ